MTDPLQPRAGDDALLDELRNNPGKARNTVKLLECWADQAKSGQSAKVLGDAAKTLRVLFNAVKENEPCKTP